MVKCFFCGREESPVRGVHLIKNDGSIQYFCSSKCRKNTLKLTRDKRKLKWTESYRIAREKIVEKSRQKDKAAETEKKIPEVKKK